MRKLVLLLLLVPMLSLTQPPQGGLIVKEMKFENVNLDTVLKALIKITGKNILIDPSIQEGKAVDVAKKEWSYGRYFAKLYTYPNRMSQKVNIFISKPLSINEAMKLIMKEFGLIAVPIDKDTYKITTLAKLEIGITNMRDKDVNEFLDLIKNKVTPSAEVVIDKKSGLILVSDSFDRVEYLFSSLERYVQGKAQDSFDIDIAGFEDKDIAQVVDLLKQKFPNADINVDKRLGFIRIYANKEDIASLKLYIDRYIKTKFRHKLKERFTTRVFFLKDIVSTDEAIKILEPHISPETLITESPTFNALVIRDKLSKINSYAKILEKFLKEKPTSRKPVTQIFYLKYITPEEFMKMIEPLRSEAGYILGGEERITGGTPRVQRIEGTRREGQMGERVEEQATGQDYIRKAGGRVGETVIYERRKSLSTILADFNAVMITDYPEVIERIKERFSQYISDVPVQVKIEAKILEVRKEVLREIGIGANVLASKAKVPGFWDAGAGVNPDVLLSPTPDLSQNPGTILTLTLQQGALNALNLKLSAYEKIGKIKNIAKPTVITVNGKEAIIKQGEELPYETIIPVVGGGTAVPTINWKEIVLELRVIPLISPDDKIMLDIVITYDTPGRTTPQGYLGINTKEIRTRAVVHHGDTLVIGGVLEKQNNKTNEGVPKLVRVPLLKWLLGQEKFEETDKELLIFLTPIVLRE